MNIVAPFVCAILGYLFAHYLAYRRLRKEIKFNLILDQLNDFAGIIDETIEELSQHENSEDFKKILLVRQRRINRKIEFVCKILKKIRIDPSDLKLRVDELREHLSGEEDSCIVTNNVHGQNLQKTKALILSSIDDIKWNIIERF